MAPVYAVLDQDTAILLFSIVMVNAALALVVAGVAIARAQMWRGWQRWVPLLCGVWPLATIPAGSAIGDVPHSLAITCWGACWIALGACLLTVLAHGERPSLQPSRH